MSNLDTAGSNQPLIYPAAITDDTIEALVSEQGPDRPVVFWVIGSLILALLLSLPLIEINLWVGGRAIVRDDGSKLSQLDEGSDVTPATVLSVDAFVGEADVKYLKVNQVCSVRYDAYPYTEWGSASGVVVDISSTPVFFNRRSLYRVTVQSKNRELHMRDGLSGKISAGMAANVRFIVNHKSLLKLVYQKGEELFAQ